MSFFSGSDLTLLLLGKRKFSSDKHTSPWKFFECSLGILKSNSQITKLLTVLPGSQKLLGIHKI